MLKIKSLSLKNFKSIGENTQTIEFAPITLLFGPNGAGKSTAIQALAFLNEVINHRNYDPIKTEIGGDAMDLGGFLNLVHKREKDQSIGIGISFDLEGNEINDLFLQFVPKTVAYQLDSMEEENWYDVYEYNVWLRSIYDISLKFNISWSDKKNRAYIKKYEIWLNGSLFSKVSSDSESSKIEYMDIKHKCIDPDFVKSFSEKAHITQGIEYYKSRIDNTSVFDSLLKKEKPFDKLSNLELFELIGHFSMLDLSVNHDLNISFYNKIVDEFIERKVFMDLITDDKYAHYHPNLGINNTIIYEFNKRKKKESLSSALNEYLTRNSPAIDRKQAFINIELLLKSMTPINSYPEFEIHNIFSNVDLFYYIAKQDMTDKEQEIIKLFLDKRNEELFRKRLCMGFWGYETNEDFECETVKKGVLRELDKLNLSLNETSSNNTSDNTIVQAEIKKQKKLLKETIDFINSYNYGINLNPDMLLSKQKDALPSLDHKISFDIKWKTSDELDDDDPTRYSHIDGVREEDFDIKKNMFTGFLENLFKGPLILLSQLLDEFVYIGPLRELPPREIRPQNIYQKSNWSKGLAAWDVLYNAEKSLLNNVNNWISEKHINTGYKVEAKRYLVIAEDEFDNLKRVEEVKALKENFPTKTKLSLFDLNNDIKVMLQDIGVGVSQLLPIVVVSCQNNDSEKATQLVAIEQPELHIHPKLQTELADLFIHASKTNNKMFLIETHSEHLILRMLRRIRESAEKIKTDNNIPEFKPKDISVIYVEPSKNGTQYSILRVDNDGDFVDEWPHGFFDERDEELFF